MQPISSGNSSDLPPLLFTLGPTKLRVLLEVRSGIKGTRELLNVNALLAACNNGRINLPNKLFNGSLTQIDGVECRTHTFGDTRQDMVRGWMR